jgi:outer membrane protein OmpU
LENFVLHCIILRSKNVLLWYQFVISLRFINRFLEAAMMFLRAFSLSLLSSVAFVSGAHAAEPTVSVGGIMNVEAGYGDNDDAYTAPGSSFSRDVKFANETEVHIQAQGQADNGIKYGAMVELEADVTADAKGEGLNADKTYLWAEGNFGRTEVGNSEPAQAIMAVNAASIARGTGGIDGNDEYYLNYFSPTGGAFLIHPDLPTADVGGIVEDATKLSYITPKTSGFQGGLSYTPDEGNGGTAAGFTTDADGDYENVIGWGLTYEAEVQGVGINVGFVGEFGENELATVEDMNAWQLGASLSYEGFSVAGSFADWNDSYKTVGTTSGDQYFWNVGLAYEQGAFGASLGYIDSRKTEGAEINQFRNTVFSVDYAVAPGLVPYGEISFFEADAGGTTVDNEGTVVILGTYLIF